MKYHITIGLAFAVMALAADDLAQPESKLVDLNVIALDNHGQPVNDLTRDDFQVRDAGKQQKIAFFRHNESNLTRALALSPNEFSNRSAAEASHATVVLFDLLNEGFGTRGVAANQLIHNLQRMETADSLYLYILTVDGRLYPVRGFADEERQGREPEGRAWTSQIKTLMDTAMRTVLRMRPSDIDVAVRVQLTFAALDALAVELSRVPGRKNMVWITDGVPILLGPVRSDTGVFVDFTPLVRQMSQVFDHCGVAIYPVRQVNLGHQDNVGVTSGDGAAAGDRTGLESLATLDEFAGLTGGRPNAGRDTGAVLKQAMDDLRSIYQIGYEPPAGNWDSKFHKLRVECKRKGVRIQAKTGYYAWPEPPGTEAKQVIEAAISSTFDAAEIGLRGTLSTDPKDPGASHFEVRIDANDIAFSHEGDQYAAQLRLAVIGYLADGRTQASAVIPLDVSYNPQKYDEALKEGVLTHNLLLSENMTKARLIVFDRGSNTFGSLTIPVDGENQKPSH